MTSKAEMLKKFKEFTKDSEFTEEDAIRLGREVNKRIAKRHKTLGDQETSE